MVIPIEPPGKRLVFNSSWVSRAKISSKINIKRTGKQCRERYHNHLRPNIRKGDWTHDEDKTLVQLKMKYGNQWAKIAKHLPGRSGNNNNS